VLLANTADRVSAGVVLGGFVCTALALLGAGGVRTVHNPKPKHLGEVLARWKKRGPPLLKRKEALWLALDRLDRAIDDHDYPQTHVVVAQKKRVKKAYQRALDAFHREAVLYNNALHEAEAKYDQDPARSWRPIKKNPWARRGKSAATRRKLAVACPVCGAAPGRHCKTGDGLQARPHAARVNASRGS
jgi:hypothetical protein